MTLTKVQRQRKPASIQIRPDLHRRIKVAAANLNISISEAFERCVRDVLPELELQATEYAGRAALRPSWCGNPEHSSEPHINNGTCNVALKDGNK